MNNMVYPISSEFSSSKHVDVETNFKNNQMEDIVTGTAFTGKNRLSLDNTHYCVHRGKGCRSYHCGVRIQWLWGYDPTVEG